MRFLVLVVWDQSRWFLVGSLMDSLVWLMDGRLIAFFCDRMMCSRQTASDGGETPVPDSVRLAEFGFDQLMSRSCFSGINWIQARQSVSSLWYFVVACEQ